MKFSDERALFAAAGMLPSPAVYRREPAGLRDQLERVSENRWYVLLIIGAALLLGALATLVIPPVYEANLLIQVADPAGPQKGFLGEAAQSFDIKTPATAEMEILRSRRVVAPAVQKHDLSVVAKPRHFPILSGPMTIVVSQFTVPPRFENQAFIGTLDGAGGYNLRHDSLPAPLQGRTGELLRGAVPGGELALVVSQLKGHEGSQFTLERKSLNKTTEDLQDVLKLTERGRQSGIIEVSVRDSDPARAAAVLNDIGANYVKLAVDRKTTEVDKALAFLGAELPALKAQMDRAETEYSKFRSRKGAIAYDEDGRMALSRTYELRGKLVDAQQKRRELLTTAGPAHPAVRSIDEQIGGLLREIGGAQAGISAMPATQQDAARLDREVKSATDVYQQLRNNARQLQLVREGVTGNTRILDAAVVPEDVVRPKPLFVMASAAAAGVVLATLFVLLRSGLARGVRTAGDIEGETGLSVYSSAIPMGRSRQKVPRGGAHPFLLGAPSADVALGLRQLRTVLQHQMRDRPNNRVMVTGPTEGVGVRFIVSHLAVIWAMAGARILLIDTDRQRGSLHKSFGMESAPGLTDLMVGACKQQDAIRPTGIPRLDLIAAGTADVDFEKASASRAFMDVLERGSRDYDIVLLTAPPVLSSPDTLSLAHIGAMVVLVARSRWTAAEDITESARRLSQAGQLPSGVVLNGV